HFLIKPPRQAFVFTALHGISWNHVKDAPSFGELWPGLAGFFAGAEFIAAHNSGFDRGVLNACCAGAGLTPPGQPFRCTVQLARKVLNIRPANLSHVCRHLCIKLNHHNALSDAEACARIMIAVLETEAEANKPA
ncbi:MAG: exonuclease, partial [Elusimicrobia bacterium RIFOXYB2_FULL_62_6]